MCGLCHFIGLDFLQGVDALAVGVEGVHEMHPARPCQCYDSKFSGPRYTLLRRLREYLFPIVL